MREQGREARTQLRQDVMMMRWGAEGLSGPMGRSSWRNLSWASSSAAQVAGSESLEIEVGEDERGYAAGEEKMEGREKLVSVGEISSRGRVLGPTGVCGCAGEGGVDVVVKLGVDCCVCPCVIALSARLCAFCCPCPGPLPRPRAGVETGVERSVWLRISSHFTSNRETSCCTSDM